LVTATTSLAGSGGLSGFAFTGEGFGGATLLCDGTASAATVAAPIGHATGIFHSGFNL